jgi:Mce-associated membrane protein
MWSSSHDHDRARVLWWSLVVVLAVGVSAAVTVAVWQAVRARTFEDARSPAARNETVKVATDATVAMLSYKPDTVEHDLRAARDRLTGKFKDAYTSLINDVVIPGSKQKNITAVAIVPTAAWASATENHAVVLVFVDQSITIGTDPPTTTASSVRVTLDKIGGQWLISGFDPV